MNMTNIRIVASAALMALAAISSVAPAEARGFGGGGHFIPHAGGGFRGGFARPGFGGGYRGGFVGGGRRFFRGYGPAIGAGILGLGALGTYEYYNIPSYLYTDPCTEATGNPQRCDSYQYGY